MKKKIQFILNKPQLSENIGMSIILFGQENNGLSNQEISYSNYILTVPTANYSSLNLSHSVSVIAYELSQLDSLNLSSKKLNYLKSDQIENFVNFIMKTLNRRKFTTVASKKLNLEISIRNFLKTSKIDEKSLKTAYGILKIMTK